MSNNPSGDLERVSVPREPTEAMLDEACYFWGPWLDEAKTERAGRRSDDPADRERARQVWAQMIAAAPAPSGEAVIWKGQDYIETIKAHRVQFGASLVVARDAVDQGWRPDAAPPPARTREDCETGAVRTAVVNAVERHISGWAGEHWDNPYDAAAEIAWEVAQALAILEPRQ